MNVHAPLKPIHTRNRRSWGDWEEACVRDQYGKVGIAELHAMLPHRTRVSIISKAKKLGLSRNGTAGVTAWTTREEVKLASMWRNATRDEILVAFLGREWKTIQSKASKMRLRRSYLARTRVGKAENPLLEQIRVRMLARNFTAAELQEVAGLKRGATRSWFGKTAEPKLKSIERVLAALDGELVIRWRD